MTAIVKELDAKLKLWRSSTAEKVEVLVSNTIALADRETPCKPSSRSTDAFLADKKIFHGSTPKDLAANHDRYLYGQA